LERESRISNGFALILAVVAEMLSSLPESDVHLASISGGTDIVSCFVLGRPRRSWRGEIQAPGLGMAVDVWSEDGNSVREQKGELDEAAQRQCGGMSAAGGSRRGAVK
jgi:acyl-coenzyme A synthetase/AMP-(fatty) acid ligase